jgi:fructose-1,6-bisphosphatase I
MADNFTLTQFILSEQTKVSHARGQLTTLLNAFEVASKYVSSKVRAAGLFSLYGAEGSTNVQGELVKKLDVVANNAFITALTRSRTVSLIVSEENAEPIVVPGGGDYVVAMDPLDGSSNIDVNISIGSIFAVYHRATDAAHGSPATVAEILRPGLELVAAGYTMYGSATQLVLTIRGGGVNGFTLDPSTGEFVLTHPKMSIPEKRAIYSINEGNTRHWFEPVQKYVQDLKTGDASYSARYVGSMVADVHRTLIYGGIFLYPADKSSKQGKLRLLYEANPMALIMEAAGGLASDGNARLLGIAPADIHQRTGVVMGSRLEVEKFLKYTGGTAH